MSEQLLTPEPVNSGCRLSGHRLDLIGESFLACRSNTPLPNHSRPAFQTGSRTSRRQVPWIPLPAPATYGWCESWSGQGARTVC